MASDGLESCAKDKPLAEYAKCALHPPKEILL